MREADDLGARIVLIIGDDELKKNAVSLKDMVSGEQKEVKLDNLINQLKVEI
jgi:histidyl-tRNA synthetase